MARPAPPTLAVKRPTMSLQAPSMEAEMRPGHGSAQSPNKWRRTGNMGDDGAECSTAGTLRSARMTKGTSEPCAVVCGDSGVVETSPRERRRRR